MDKNCKTFENTVKELHRPLYDNNSEYFMKLLDQYTEDDRKFLTTVRYNGITPLFYAAITDNAVIIKYLITHCNSPTDQKCDFYNWERVTPFWAAVVQRKCAAVNVLLSFDANINSRGWWGSTALIKALVEKDLPMARMLLSYGANVEVCTDERKTALMAATFDIGVAKELLSRIRYNLHQQDVHGDTALHHAVRNKHLDVASLLVKSGLDPLTPNHKGVDALTLVREQRKRLMGVPPVCRRLHFAPPATAATKIWPERRQCTEVYNFDLEERDPPTTNPYECGGDWGDISDSSLVNDYLPTVDRIELQACYYRR